MGDPGSPIPAAPIPPQNRDAEESVLGAMMLTKRAIEAVAETRLAARDFYRGSHGEIFAAILALYAKGEPVDAITVVDELDRTSKLEDAGGAERIHELAALVPAAGNAAHYARIVGDMSTLRGLIRVGTDVARLGFDRPGETSELVATAEELVYNLAQSRETSDLVSARDATADAFAKLQERVADDRDVIGIPSGYHHLDGLLSGFQPGNLIVVAARPSMGKTALALGITGHASIRAKKHVALFTLEMTTDEVMQRLMSGEGLVDSTKIRNGRNLNSEDWERVLNVSGVLENAKLWIDDSALITIAEIRSKCRRLKARGLLDLVVLDYLQLMTGSGEENRVQEVSKMSRALKILARELEVPVVALSQLSRNVESRHDKRPMLSDLRESGSIEQDADVVLFLYRDEYYNPEETDQEGIAEVNVAKQRNGPTGVIKLAFARHYARFSTLERYA